MLSSFLSFQSISKCFSYINSNTLIKCNSDLRCHDSKMEVQQMVDVLHIPDDILHVILARLPTKPLLRFKCVSTHWNRMISDPYFMKSKSRRMILVSIPALHAIDDNAPADNKAHSWIKLRCPFQNLHVKWVNIVGTFNGIVFMVLTTVSEETRMILYNPFTGAANIVPDPPLRLFNTPIYAYGFGYGVTPDDLKIVRLRYDFSSTTCDVFSLKKSSWSTPLTTLIGRLRFPEDVGTFVNGFLYWRIVRNNGSVITALNVKEMEFSEICLPPECDYWLTPLGTLNGCLCMISPRNNLHREYDLWVMKDDAWWKAYSFTLLFGGITNGWFDQIRILDNGKILKGNSSSLIIYDTLRNSHKELRALSTLLGLDTWTLSAVEYVESLTSPSDLCSGLISL